MKQAGENPAIRVGATMPVEEEILVRVMYIGLQYEDKKMRFVDKPLNYRKQGVV